MDIQNIFGAEHSNYMAALNISKSLTGTARNTSFADVLATNSVNSQVVTATLEARAARQASVDSRQNLQDNLAGKVEDKQGPITDFADYKLLFPTLHSDVAEFKKENPDVSQRELWNYIDEKYNLHRSATVITLEEAQASTSRTITIQSALGPRLDGIPDGIPM